MHVGPDEVKTTLDNKKTYDVSDEKQILNSRHQLTLESGTSASTPLPVWINPNDLSFEGAKRFRKIASIRARPVHTGELIITVIRGNVETCNQAKPGDYIVTNPGGEQYVVPGEEFNQKYRLKPGTSDTYLPIAPPVRAIITTQPVAFISPWGTPMYIQAGGALVEHPDGCYGIQPEEFALTYHCVDSAH